MIKKVFHAICNDNLHTRRLIAENLSVSTVTVGKAVDSLIDANIISASGKTSEGAGRRSDFLDIVSDNKILLISLDAHGFCYSLSDMGGGIDICRLSYVESLDYVDNISILITHLKKRVGCKPLKTIVALPGDLQDGRMINTYISDYSGARIDETFESNGIVVDQYLSFSDAIRASGRISDGDVFISIGNNVWGDIGRGRIECWDSVSIDAKGELTIRDAIRSCGGEERLFEYVCRFVKLTDSFFSPTRISLSTDRMGEAVKERLGSSIEKLMLVNADELIFEGAYKIAVEKILEEIKLKNEKALALCQKV